MRIEDNLAAGMSSEEARRDARLRFGNPAVMKEKVVAMDMNLRLERILADIRFAGRLLRRNPLFASLVVTIMALAIGTASVAYSVVDVWLVRKLPFRDADRLVALWAYGPAQSWRAGLFYFWPGLSQLGSWQQLARRDGWLHMAPLHPQG